MGRGVHEAITPVDLLKRFIFKIKNILVKKTLLLTISSKIIGGSIIYLMSLFF